MKYVMSTVVHFRTSKHATKLIVYLKGVISLSSITRCTVIPHLPLRKKGGNNNLSSITGCPVLPRPSSLTLVAFRKQNDFCIFWFTLFKNVTFNNIREDGIIPKTRYYWDRLLSRDLIRWCMLCETGKVNSSAILENMNMPMKALCKGKGGKECLNSGISQCPVLPHFPLL